MKKRIVFPAFVIFAVIVVVLVLKLQKQVVCSAVTSTDFLQTNGANQLKDKGLLVYKDAIQSKYYVVQLTNKVEDPELGFVLGNVNVCAFDSEHREYFGISLNANINQAVPDYGLRFEDVNNDKNVDIMIPSAIGYSGVNVYYKLLVNKTTEFVELSGFESVGNPRIEGDTIFSNQKSATNMELKQVYKIQDGKLVLISSESKTL